MSLSAHCTKSFLLARRTDNWCICQFECTEDTYGRLPYVARDLTGTQSCRASPYDITCLVMYSEGQCQTGKLYLLLASSSLFCISETCASYLGPKLAPGRASALLLAAAPGFASPPCCMALACDDTNRWVIHIQCACLRSHVISCRGCCCCAWHECIDMTCVKFSCTHYFALLGVS